MLSNSKIKIMIFKHRRRANRAMPVNTTMPANTAMPMFLTSCKTNTHTEIMAESKLLCFKEELLLPRLKT